MGDLQDSKLEVPTIYKAYFSGLYEFQGIPIVFVSLSKIVPKRRVSETMIFWDPSLCATETKQPSNEV